MGPLIITKKGMANDNGSPKDIDKEFVMMFSIFDENESWLLNKNIDDHLIKNNYTESILDLKKDKDFIKVIKCMV